MTMGLLQQEHGRPTIAQSVAFSVSFVIQLVSDDFAPPYEYSLLIIQDQRWLIIALIAQGSGFVSGAWGQTP